MKKYVSVAELNRRGIAPTAVRANEEYVRHVLGDGRAPEIVLHETERAQLRRKHTWAKRGRIHWESTLGRLHVQAQLSEQELREEPPLSSRGAPRGFTPTRSTGPQIKAEK